MKAGSRKRVAALISGRGANMSALINATIDPQYPAEITLVLSNRADAAGLAVADVAGIATRAIPHGDFDTREDHDAAVDAALTAANIDLVCLAGYMRLLTADFVKRWQGRMINIHPALLPSFKGIDTHARALAAGCRLHGATVHFVTADMDEGPIILQGAVPVLSDDTEETLAGRVLNIEHRLYPAALAMVSNGSVRMSGGGAVFSGAISDPNRKLSLIAPDIGRQ